LIIGSRAIWPQRQDGSAFFCDNFDFDDNFDLDFDDNFDLDFDDNFDLNLKTDNLNFDLNLEITLTLTLTLKLITVQP
jgi:hypothetical protein